MRGKLGISAFGAGGPSARAAHRGVFGNSIGNFLAVPFAVEGDAKPDFRLANLREGTKEMNFPHPAMSHAATFAVREGVARRNRFRIRCVGALPSSRLDQRREDLRTRHREITTSGYDGGGMAAFGRAATSRLKCMTSARRICSARTAGRRVPCAAGGTFGSRNSHEVSCRFVILAFPRHRRHRVHARSAAHPSRSCFRRHGPTSRRADCGSINATRR